MAILDAHDPATVEFVQDRTHGGVLAGRHDIRPEVEPFPVADFERALDRVRKGGARYRAVVEIE